MSLAEGVWWTVMIVGFVIAVAFTWSQWSDHRRDKRIRANEIEMRERVLKVLRVHECDNGSIIPGDAPCDECGWAGPEPTLTGSGGDR